jgi:hypothetical protein
MDPVLVAAVLVLLLPIPVVWAVSMIVRSRRERRERRARNGG